MKNTQILQAATYGTMAFNAGKTATPCHDRNLMEMLKGRSIGEKREEEATSIELMDAWSKAWHAANMASNS